MSVQRSVQVTDHTNAASALQAVFYSKSVIIPYNTFSLSFINTSCMKPTLQLFHSVSLIQSVSKMAQIELLSSLKEKHTFCLGWLVIFWTKLVSFFSRQYNWSSLYLSHFLFDLLQVHLFFLLTVIMHAILHHESLSFSFFHASCHFASCITFLSFSLLSCIQSCILRFPLSSFFHLMPLYL